MIDIEDTFAEAFPMKASRLIITALNKNGLRKQLTLWICNQ